jgi:conjugal transfer mating pair stabilization protein TraG
VIATEKFMSASTSVEGGIGLNLGIARAGATARATAGVSRRQNSSQTASNSREVARISDALESWSQNNGWSQASDRFERSVQTTSSAEVSSRAAGITSSATDAFTQSREARSFYERADRLEKRWSLSEGEGAMAALNTTDAFLSFARAEMGRTPLVYRSFDPANAAHWGSADPLIAAERSLLVSRYSAALGRTISEEVYSDLPVPSDAGLSRPRTTRPMPEARISPDSMEALPDNVGEEMARPFSAGSLRIKADRAALDGDPFQ